MGKSGKSGTLQRLHLGKVIRSKAMELPPSNPAQPVKT